MSQQTPPIELALLERAALAAANMMLAATRSGRSLVGERKGDSSLVTELDLQSQREILNVLGRALPVVAEEDPASHALIETQHRVVLVDPLDGTSSCRRYFQSVRGQVGFGPLLGLTDGGRLVAGVFFNLPARALFSAALGCGSTIVEYPDNADFSAPPPFHARRLLQPNLALPLIDSALLFLPSGGGETELAEYLRVHGIVDNAYRFGGFANDVSRLARGSEQIQLQTAVKSWDYSAAMLAAEAGYDVIVDPFGAALPLREWRVASNNPVLICPPSHTKEMLGYLRLVRPGRGA